MKSWMALIMLVILLGFHYLLLNGVPFVVWPEMFIYPWLIHNGLVLYRDWLAMYPPVLPYGLAAVFNFIGTSPASVRTFGYILILLTDSLLYFIALSIFRSVKLSFIVTVFYIIWLPLFEGHMLWFESFITPLVLLAYWFIVTASEKKLLKISIAGFLFGVSFLVKQNILWTYIAAFFYLLLVVRSNFKTLIYFSLSFFGPILLIFSWYFINKEETRFLYWIFIFPINTALHDTYFRLRPAGPDVRLVIPAYLISLITLWMSSIYKFSHEKENRIRLLIFFIVSTSLFAFPRWGLFHLATSLVFIALSMGYLCTLVSEFIKLYTGRILSIIAISLLFLLSFKSFKYYLIVKLPMIRSYDDAGMQQLATQIENKTNGGKFYIFGNYDFLYYYLKEKPTILPWVQLFPALAEAKGVQETIIKSLQRDNIEYIIYFPYHEDKVFYSEYVPRALYEYINSNYTRLSVLPHKGWVLRRNPNE